MRQGGALKGKNRIRVNRCRLPWQRRQPALQAGTEWRINGLLHALMDARNIPQVAPASKPNAWLQDTDHPLSRRLSGNTPNLKVAARCAALWPPFYSAVGKNSKEAYKLY
jgi:hypothetical protein